jgi:hypothetical protein
MNCDACGLPVREDEAIQFEGRWICAACKPTFVQQLKEGVLAPVGEPLPDGFEGRTLGMGELIALSWRVVCKDWVAIAGIVLLVAVPINFFLTMMDPGEEPSMHDVGRSFRLQTTLETLVGVLSSLGIAKIVSGRLQGKKVGFLDALLHAVSRWLPAAGTGIIEGFILVFMFLLLIVPGIMWAGYYTFSIPIVSLRACAGKTALDYSKALVKGRWWGVIGRVLGLSLLSMIPVIVIEVGIEVAPKSEVLTYASAVFSDLCFAFTSVGTAVLFLNLDAIHRRDPVFDSWRARL